MDDNTMIVILTLLGLCSFTTIGYKFLSLFSGRKAKETKALEAELVELRQEVVGLRSWANAANDLILSSESALQQQDARLRSVERRALGEPEREESVVRGAAVREPVEVHAQA
jgi:hypothetical protein